MPKEAFSFLTLAPGSRFGAVEPRKGVGAVAPTRALSRVIRPRSHIAIHDEKMDSMLTHFCI